MPAVQDIRRAVPHAHIDWVVERGFAPLVQRCEGVRHVIPCEIRRWRKAPLAAATRREWRVFRETLKREQYDAIIDLQGLTKSALVARLAQVATGGRRFALANQTAGSSYEAPTRWLADVAIQVPEHSHAVHRSRHLCATALGYDVPAVLRYGLARGAASRGDAAGSPRPVVFVHGTSRADKSWPDTHWVALGKRLLAQGARIALPHGSEEERVRSEAIAGALGADAEVWPRLSLDALTDAMADSAGVIGVDSGLSHIAVALNLPHVQIYNFDTAWRTGPVGSARQRSVFAQSTPGVDAVLAEWGAVTMPP